MRNDRERRLTAQSVAERISQRGGGGIVDPISLRFCGSSSFGAPEQIPGAARLRRLFTEDSFSSIVRLTWRRILRQENHYEVTAYGT
jgi:hypothetical protein